MSLDQQLTRSLQEVAGAHEPPSLEFAGILAGGRRRRRVAAVRKTAVGLACLAVIATGIVAAGQLSRQGAVGPSEHGLPERVADLPVGAPPAMPYCAGNRTIIDAGTAIQARCEQLVHRGSFTLAFDSKGVRQVVDGRLTLLDRRVPSQWFPAMSQDGRYAAWVAREPSALHGAVLLVFDLQLHTRLAEVAMPIVYGWTPGIDDLGRVYFEIRGAGDIWAYDIPEGRLIQVRGLPRRLAPSVRFVTSDGFAVGVTPFYYSDTGRSTSIVGVVTRDGRFVQRHEVQQGWSTYSPGRSRFVEETADGFQVVPRDGSGMVQIQLPTTGTATWYPVWESETELLFQFDPQPHFLPTGVTGSNGVNVPANRTYLLRCSATSGRCEVALEPGWGDDLDWLAYR